MRISELYAALDKLYPFSSAADFDNAGFSFKGSDREIKKAVLCLDVTDAAAEFAVSESADIVISHHPLVFDPLKSLSANRDKALLTLIKNDISALSLHTNFDTAPCGMNETLASAIGVAVTGGFSKTPSGLYEGLLGRPPFPDVRRTALVIKDALSAPSVRVYAAKETAALAAVVAGSGSSLMEEAVAAGADLIITGDCKHHAFIDAARLGISVIDAGHFYTERIFSSVLSKTLSDLGVPFTVYADVAPYQEI